MNESQAAEQIMRESIDRPDPEVLGRNCRVTAYQVKKGYIIEGHYPELEALCAENAELRKDKARLDWLNYGNWKAERFNATVWLTRTEKGYDLNLYPTIRDAIDAQMK